ncbi:MAG: UDP-2,3-diacylglucosamine diphosphatase [Bacteroidota bacterium]
MNRVSLALGRGRIHLSKSVKDSVKSAVKFVDDFEGAAAKMAIRTGVDYVVCGHIHAPQIRTVTRKEGSVVYLNSGDWIENMSALEYAGGKWSVYRYEDDPVAREANKGKGPKKEKKAKELFRDLVEEFRLLEEASLAEKL